MQALFSVFVDLFIQQTLAATYYVAGKQCLLLRIQIHFE